MNIVYLNIIPFMSILGSRSNACGFVFFRSHSLTFQLSLISGTSYDFLCFSIRFLIVTRLEYWTNSHNSSKWCVWISPDKKKKKKKKIELHRIYDTILSYLQYVENRRKSSNNRDNDHNHRWEWLVVGELTIIHYVANNVILSYILFNVLCLRDSFRCFTIFSFTMISLRVVIHIHISMKNRDRSILYWQGILVIS